MTPEQRALRARIGAHAMHAQGKTNTGPARAAFADRWEKQVDPEGVLSPDERARRAHHAMKAHFSRMAAKSAKARARRNRAA
ncbi:hypothetical protein [Prauserella flavalba]|uniref:Uncharacterized protein n=1 Tax=Prauserella flavalba TaxID=1477506 RepID=A0A318LLD0_9PSEU|nr:hypothetical protein [Prauserella flavalba]PXY16488.1 hypothetical protein BA062_38785 [Prauserella flavalba]